MKVETGTEALRPDTSTERMTEWADALQKNGRPGLAEMLRLLSAERDAAHARAERLAGALVRIIDYDDENLSDAELKQHNRYSGAMSAYRRLAALARAALATQEGRDGG